MPSRHLLSSLAVAIVLALSSAAVEAGPQGGGRRGPPPVPQNAGPRQHGDDALSDSVRRIERSTRGQVLSAERVPYDGRDVNRIKTVDERGRVRVYMDDPRNGQSRQPDPPSD